MRGMRLGAVQIGTASGFLLPPATTAAFFFLFVGEEVGEYMPSKPSFGLVQVFWGNGKGKTTAAIGEGLRALGRGFKVHLLQFMKCGIEGNQDFQEYGELLALKQFPGFTLERYGSPSWVIGKPKPAHLKAAAEALAATKKAVASGEFDMVIIDEILYAVQLGLIRESDVLDVIQAKAKDTELLLTGSHQELKAVNDAADLVTHLQKMKHPFDQGILARVGTEF